MIDWMKKIDVFTTKKAEEDNLVIENSSSNNNKVIDKSPLMLSPVDLLKQSCLVRTPKTPRIEDCDSESRLESLPMDLLVILYFSTNDMF